jgi:tetratricopeptide (TPR) repeat protein
MESFARAIRDLTDTLSWFVRAREVRVLHVRTRDELRATALRLIAAQELHPENRSPWVILEDPSTTDSDGWLARVERLRAQHASRRNRMAEEREHLPELPERPTAAEPLTAFGAQLAQLLDARADWHEGLVVVLAPTRVERPRAVCDALRALLDARPLGAVRWVFIDPEPAALEPVAAHVGEQAMRTVFLVDDAEAQRDLANMLDAAERAPTDISGPARIGAAWPPGVSPPPRPGWPSADPETIDALLREEGLDLPLAGARGTELGRAVLRGAQALRRGHAAQAVQHQTRACSICIESGLLREATIMQLVLGAYLVAAGDAGRAMQTYASASTQAEWAGVPDLGAQAQLALGALHLRAGERPEAAVAYARGAALARKAGSAILTIEAMRLAGQAQLDLGHEEEAVRVWAAALEVAEAALAGTAHAGAEPGAPERTLATVNGPNAAEVKASSAAEVARSLAAIMKKRGLKEKATALEERSRDLE